MSAISGIFAAIFCILFAEAYTGYLTDTILTAQDRYKAILDYFKIKY